MMAKPAYEGAKEAGEETILKKVDEVAMEDGLKGEKHSKADEI